MASPPLPPIPAPRLIAVGSTNPSKVGAVARTVGRAWPEAQVRGVEVPSGGPDQPLHIWDGVGGALNRAEAALHALDASLGIGIEGYTEDYPFGMFTTTWIAVIDAAGRVGLGSSGRCPLPAPLVAAIHAGGELGPLIDDLVGETDTKHRGGAAAAFTAGLIERTDSLSYGVAFALAPFLTPAYFGPGGLWRLADLRAVLAARP